MEDIAKYCNERVVGWKVVTNVGRSILSAAMWPIVARSFKLLVRPFGAQCGVKIAFGTVPIPLYPSTRYEVSRFGRPKLAIAIPANGTKRCVERYTMRLIKSAGFLFSNNFTAKRECVFA